MVYLLYILTFLNIFKAMVALINKKLKIKWLPYFLLCFLFLTTQMVPIFDIPSAANLKHLVSFYYLISYSTMALYIMSSWDQNYAHRAYSTWLLYVIYKTSQDEQSTTGNLDKTFIANIHFLDADIIASPVCCALYLKLLGKRHPCSP